MVIGTTRNVLGIAIIQLAIVLMATSCGVLCSSSNGGAGRYMLVEEQEEPPIVLTGSAESKVGASFNDLLLGMKPVAPSSQLPAPASNGVVEPPAHHPSGGQCRIEFQVTKVLPGWCTRLGRSSGRACVSGNHLIPFHPDCM